MTPEQREAHVKHMAAEREKLSQQIQELGRQRQAFLNEQMKKNPSRADQAFDEAIKDVLREQARNKGLVIPK